MAVWYATIFHISNECIRKASGDANGINAFDKSVNSLPFTHPTVIGAHDGNQSIEVVAGAVVHIVFVTFHPQK